MLPQWVSQFLGRYQVTGVIGQGGMGIVLKAHDPELRRVVAVKVLFPNLAADSELVERFRREAWIGANLDHPSIVAIHDVGQEGSSPYVVMEYIEGRPLSAILQQEGPLPRERVLAIAEQIASALDYIHKQGLVHRDVKANNILVDGQGRAVLTDFGLVRALGWSAMTASGRILGTPQYMAPEQISGGQVGPWTDLYALAIVIYKMLSGRFPFDGDTPSAILFQVLWNLPPPIDISQSRLPEAVNDVLRQALAKDPSGRYATGFALVHDLSGALARAGSPAGKDSWTPARPRALLRGRPFPSWVWTALGVFLLFLAAGLFLVLGGGPILRGAPVQTAPALRTTAPSQMSPPTLQASSPEAAPVARTGAPTQPPALTAVQIVQVEYDPAGPALDEWVLIQNAGEDSVDVTGWTLRDRAGHIYLFPGLTLGPGASIRVWTRAGQDTATDLYMGRGWPIWNNDGDCASLWDLQGQLVVQHCY